MTDAPAAAAPTAAPSPAETTTRLRDALTTITAHWDAMLPDGPPPTTTGTIGRTTHTITPIAAHILDARRDTLDTLHFYARVVLDERSGHHRMPGRVTLDAPALARFLHPHTDWLAHHELAPTALDDLTHAARTVHAAAHPRTREQTTFVGPCECGARVHAAPGVDLIECAQCQRATHRHDLHRHAETEAAGWNATAAEIEATSPRIGGRHVTARQIRQWARVYNTDRAHLNPNPLRKRGQVRDHNGRMVDRYNIGEVWARYDLELARQHERAQRRATVGPRP